MEQRPVNKMVETNNVVTFPVSQKVVSKNRSRDQVLAVLIPQLLGLIWDRGGPDPLKVHGGPTVRIGSQIAAGGYLVAPGVFGVHVYAEHRSDPYTKVFSVHLADRAAADPGFNYLEGRCAVLSWKRGAWEDTIMHEQTDPRTIAHVLTAGLSRRPLG